MTKHIFYHGDVIDCLRKIPEKSVNTVVTSPPYWGLRDYGVDGQIGLEKTPEEYIAKLVNVFREVWRVLRDDGTLWLNLGDSYIANKTGNPLSGSTLEGGKLTQIMASKRLDKKPGNGLKLKDLIGIPWRVALALQADGWYLRSDIIWAKPNPMPESVTDRPTKAHEYLFLLAKSQKYYYDHEAIKEEASTTRLDLLEFGPRPDKGYPGHMNDRRRKKTDKHPNRTVKGFNDRWDKAEAEGKVSGTRNKRDVWVIPTHPFPEAHFATFPPELVRPCILAGSPAGGTVLDPFGGSGTVSMVAMQEGRDSIYIDLNREYLDIALRRCGFDGSKLIFDQYEIKEAKHGSRDNCLHNCATW